MGKYLLLGVIAVIIILSIIAARWAKKHISDSEAEEGCDTCRWQYVRSDRVPCSQCEHGSQWEKSELEGQDID